MRTKTWKELEDSHCDECGSRVEVFTECKGDLYMDKQACRCQVCGATGHTKVDEDGHGSTWLDRPLDAPDLAHHCPECEKKIDILSKDVEIVYDKLPSDYDLTDHNRAHMKCPHCGFIDRLEDLKPID